MCIKVDNRIECEPCGYPLSEALYPDDYDDPLDCNASIVVINEHIMYVNSLIADRSTHPWDCLCLIHR